MTPDLNQLSDKELESIASGDLESLSDQTLQYILGESKDTKYNPEQPSKGMALINRIPSANREFLRSIGTNKNMLDEYMRGLDEPQISETFQNQLIRQSNDLMTQFGVGKLPTGVQTGVRFAGGLPGSVTGKAADIVTSPVEALLSTAGDITPSQAVSTFKSVGKGLANVPGMVSRATRRISKPSSMEVNEMINMAKQEVSDFGQVINRAEASDVANVGVKYSQTRDILVKNVDNINKQVSSVAHETTLLQRQNYSSWAKDLSSRYGSDYVNAIAGDKIPTKDLYDSVGRVINKSRMLERAESTWSSSEKSIYKYFKSLEDDLPRIANKTKVVFTKDRGAVHETVKLGDEFKDLSTVDREVKSLLQIKEGKLYSQGDHILTDLRQEISNVFGEVSPKLKLVRAKFKPELQAKNEAFNIFQPFNKSGTFDTTRGMEFFKRYANSNLKEDEKLFIEALKSRNGGSLFKSLDDLANQKSSIVNQIKTLPMQKEAEVAGVKMAHTETKARTMMENESHLDLLDAMLQDANKRESMGQLLNTVGKYSAKAALGGGVAGAVGGAAFGIGKKLSQFIGE